ncbi:histone-lysine N-methyltransferase (Ash1), putative [Metarhizium acridum CQMa 102]|uniref:Histone-lysine N-methyltransferase (Ash1), putative n=1 Tax=Metarhizium acridum (strain CQMa 102) TaxID=655827 RepID=E9EDJ0_METAQ|nr:histone-lysine N-methyltransferase (Ash1), putative [Metarhizium acridum CQMa 102]EFY85986.1 histone-lysine N-methyltransferase (Ash1), putative [Metarhizium acridum CQMa 102]
MSLFAESSLSGATTDTSSTLASSSSTPPTTLSDTDSQHSDAPKHDVITVADDAIRAAPVQAQEPSPCQSPPAPSRPRRTRVSEPVYNLSRLSGTADHGKRRANGDAVADKRRRTISGDTLVGSIEVAGDGSSKAQHKDKALKAGIDALNLQWSPESLHTPRTRRQAQASPRPLRTSSRRNAVSSIATTLTSMGKKGRKAVNMGVAKMSRELRRLQDTNEFSGIDDRPVIHTIWANGKFVDPNAPPPEPARKKAKVQDPAEEDESDQEEQEPITTTKKNRVKKYLDKGLYAGQEMPADVFKGLTASEKKKLASLPELAPSGRVNTTMPSPIYTGLRMLIAGRDFKLPFNTCNPLPPGQPKPDEWKKMTKNRFIGDSKDYWRKMPHMHDLSKIMLYECDAGNCNIGKELCTNRSFSDLAARRSKGGKYRVGVEVIKTPDRGYGVRSNRCFKANQIIMEYTGEIITEEECERRMNEEYKNNECYYLMSFDQNMIIDATTGSIARFVNHSCNPNCRMIKWIVSGQPRMALFAGDRPIMTGDELTYDYNFDPFSAKNVQKCLCGEHNCRGVLGPKPRDVKPAKADIKKTVKATVKAGKRKLKELIGEEEAENGKAKKRKIVPATGVQRSISNASLKAAKGAATALKKGVSSITAKGKKTMANKSPVQRRASTGGAVIKKKTTTKLVKKNGPGGRVGHVSSRAASMTIVAVADEDAKPGKKGKVVSPAGAKRTLTASSKVSRVSFSSTGRVLKPSPKAKIRMVPQE